MKTLHKILIGDARKFDQIENDSIECIITSPPYPMIEMWDCVFSKLNPCITDALNSNNGQHAFGLMHDELDKVWKECFRVLKPGCIACINIGDAVRTINGNFQLYSNHSRIIHSMCAIGFTQLPDIIWRKQTNAPNKFMGSGMLPACAYVTYEHEYILIFRKGEKRNFTNELDKANRRNSAFFWEERNVWFSDVWNDLKGTSQRLNDVTDRKRSAAFPFELAYRLICMHTIYGDTILDPFLGTGTSSAAAVASCRNSIGIEMDKELTHTIHETLQASLTLGKNKTIERLSRHTDFITEQINRGKKIKYQNSAYSIGVITSQETDIILHVPKQFIAKNTMEYEVEYSFKQCRCIDLDLGFDLL
ncbi:MAG: site-specific DNA-methyltransferase [Desulfobacterales bacterium]|nr:site-specific DNA-methyltransferase [Desulfobacterales bacterium]